MAQFEIPTLDFLEIRRGDRFDVSFGLEGFDLTGQNLLMQVKPLNSNRVVLEFSTDDGSITFIPVPDEENTWTIRLQKVAPSMEIIARPYRYDMEAYTNVNDITTILKGLFDVEEDVTRQ